MVNEETLETFDSKKKSFQENRRGLNECGNVKELLLFHGTDTVNVDSIAENNFDIDAFPTHKNGRGVYMANNPALQYGDTLLLCRVSISPPHLPNQKIQKASSTPILDVCRFFLER